MKIKQFIGAVSAWVLLIMPLAVPDSMNVHAEKKSSYEFYLGGQYGTNDSFWSAGDRGNSPVIVSEDNKEYILKVVGYGEQVQAKDFILYIQTDVDVNDYSSVNIEVTSVKVDGQPVNYTRSDGALTVGNNRTDLRLNICNQHQHPQGVLDIDPNFVVSSEIEVTFRTIGLFTPEEPATEIPLENETAISSTTIATEVIPETTAPPEITQAVVTTTATVPAPTVEEETVPFVASAEIRTNAYTIGDRNYIFVFLLAGISCLMIVVSKRKHK